MGDSDLSRLMVSGTIVDGTGELLLANDGRAVGHLYETSSGIWHLFDIDGALLEVFESKKAARAAARKRWRRDGSTVPHARPPVTKQ